MVLSGAKVVNLMDRAASWPGPGGLRMGGFAYENLVPHGHFPLARRLEWVAAATPSTPRSRTSGWPTVLRNSGEDEDAREVLLAKQRRRRETLPLGGEAVGVPPGLDGGLRLPAGPGGAVDGGAVGGGLGGLRARRPAAAQGGGAPALERRRCSPWTCCCR